VTGKGHVSSEDASNATAKYGYERDEAVGSVGAVSA